MYISKYWGNFIGGSDDSLNLVAFLEDQKKEEISLSEIFAKIGLDKQNWDFRQTIEYLEFTHSNGVDMDFHFAIDVITDLAAILLECYVNGSVNLHDLDEYNTPSRCIRIIATPEEHNAMDRTLADFAKNPLSYDLHEMMDDEEIQEMARDVEALRKELYESAGRNRNYYVKAEDMKSLLPDWDGANGCIATNRITVEGCKVGYCYREKPDGDWDSGWRFTAGDESDAYMDDPNNSGIYGLNTICNDDPDIISLLQAPVNSAFERDENGMLQQIEDWKPDEDEEDSDMDILEQCQKWHESDKHQKIIDALEIIPAEERTPEIDMELARAYNNLGDPDNPEGRKLLHQALELMQSHEEELRDTYSWNFRMGYAYFYLEQEGCALRYFEKALELHPGDDPKLNTRQDIEELIDWCQKRISMPQFSECFRERTEIWWETFAEMEAQLRQMIDENEDHIHGAELVAQMQETLNLVFEDISFEMGFNGEKHELILTPEGDKVKLFELVYFQKHAPKEILEHWNILVGRQSVENIGLRTGEWYISGEDVQIWLEELDENRFALETYCEKLLPMLAEEEGRVWWMLTTLTDQVLGEIPHMRYIEAFDVLTEPKAEPAELLSRLPNILKEKSLDLSTDPESYLETYMGYSMEPNDDPEADWRLDTIAGSTCCAALINGYLDNDNDYMDDLHADGAVAGFFCYPLDTLREEEGSQKIFDFRDQLEGVFTTDEGSEVLTLTGGATGIYCGYVDFIAWDIRTALQMAKEFFADTDLPWTSFHTFRREASTVYLKQTENDDLDSKERVEELEETLTGMNYFSYTPENAEAFYQQLEQWNDEDEYTRCIQVLNAIPEEWWDYRIAYAMARALENYAIIGDHDEGTPNYKGDKALLRAIDVLESVREEGQDKAEWNMRMAYAYQYLHRQEEKAIPYAQRWSELDPEDTDAPLVIQECQKEIARRAEEEPEDESDPTGVFTGFVLLSKGKWDKQQFMEDMKEKWNIIVDEHDASEDKSDDALVFEVGDMLAAVSLGTYPIPNGEAEINAENNYMWDDAVKIAKEHCAHIMVAVLGKEEDLLEKGKLFTKLVAACCRQKYATGVYTSGVVFEPRFYEGFADMLQNDELPIFNWIWFGLYHDENGMNAYTYGMDVFGKDEMEVLGTDAEPSNLRDFLASLVSYVLENDVELHDGETIGFSAGDKRTISRSPGVSLPKDQMTLKISYDSDKSDVEAGEGELDTLVMDDGVYHVETIQKKNLPMDEINAYNHMAIYLRWAMERDLMNEEFIQEYGDLVEQAKIEHTNVDLRVFIRDGLEGQLFTTLFNRQGQAFAYYYYGENDAPYYPSDIDNYAIGIIGQERNYSDEIQDEAYLFIPFDEEYYQAMAKVIEKRFMNWQGQDFNEDTLEPSEVAQAIMEYLDCECTYFPSMADDDPITAAYSYAKRDSAHEGFVPVLIKADDETLLECLVMNADPKNDADFYEFDLKTVTEYRKKMLSTSVKDGKAVLEEMIGLRKEEADDDDMDWEEEILGKMENGYENNRFSSFWEYDTDMTYPMILAKIPVKHPWEIFAYLPFGNWNECPDTPELMAVAKYWFEQYGVVPAAMTHDELEFDLPTAISKECATEVALEQYGFCPDVVNQGPEDATLGSLADVLWQSKVWYFWWD